MPAHDAKAAIRRWVEAWNTQDLDAAEELLTPEFVRHDANPPDVVGPQAEQQHMADNLAAFPDLHFEIEQLITEGDLGRDGRVGPAPPARRRPRARLRRRVQRAPSQPSLNHPWRDSGTPNAPPEARMRQARRSTPVNPEDAYARHRCRQRQGRLDAGAGKPSCSAVEDGGWSDLPIAVARLGR
jgi:SnoaL-like polyketide cyclase